MAWGGQREGAGRHKAATEREVVSYRVDPKVSEWFSTFCFYLRVPLNATLEYVMRQWLLEHHEDMMEAYREMEADEAAFMKRSISAANLETLGQKDINKRVKEKMETFLQGLRSSQEDAVKIAETERFQKLRGLVASACHFLITNKNKDPRNATPEEIRDILGIADLCTVEEIAKAFADLDQYGEIDRIIQAEAKAKAASRSPWLIPLP